MNFKQIVGIFVFSTTFIPLFGQIPGSSAPSGTETPKWVLMMEDPNVNYFEAIREYRQYWKYTAKPVEEDESGDSDKKSERKIRREREERERNDKVALTGPALEKQEYLIYQSKRFEDWARDVKPWVQENGHILSDSERMEIQRKQTDELRRQQGK